MVLGSLQQQVAAALYWPLRSFPGLALCSSSSNCAISERSERLGLPATALGDSCGGLQLKPAQMEPLGTLPR